MISPVTQYCAPVCDLNTGLGEQAIRLCTLWSIGPASDEIEPLWGNPDVGDGSLRKPPETTLGGNDWRAQKEETVAFPSIS